MISFYIHIPFCVKKCGYCDFYSVCNFDDKLIDKYVESLINQYNDFINEGVINKDKKVYTIFFGGGTPSLLKPKHFENIINVIDPKHESVEITLEANPDTINYEFLRDVKSVGINRLSIGVQSFDNDVLNTLDRTHNPQNVENAAKYAKHLNLPFSLDLIYGAPNESMISWKNTVESAIKLAPNHISAYALTLEKSVPLYKKILNNQYPEIDQDAQAEKYEQADKILRENGYEWYEISNWKKIDKCENVSLHNLAYWNNQNWIGLGVSAHSHIKNDIIDQRFWVKPDIKQFITNSYAQIEKEILDDDAILLESIMLNCRLNQNIKERLDLSDELCKVLIDDNFIDSKFHLTLKGRLLNDQMINIIYIEKSTRKCEKYLTSRCSSCPQCVMD